MDNIIHSFVNVNKYENTELVIPTTKHYNETREQIIDQYGYDDVILEYMMLVTLLLDISTKAGKKYTNDTYIIRGKAFTRLKLTQKSTIAHKSPMMLVPVNYIKLGQTSKIGEVTSIKMGSLVKDNDFYYKYWKTGKVFEINIIRSQKVMEQHLKKPNNHLSIKELNSFIQKWRTVQTKLSKASNGAISSAKVQVPPSDVQNSPILNGDIVIVTQKSSALSGRKHYFTTPVNPFTAYISVSITALDLFLLNQNIIVADKPQPIPLKRTQSILNPISSNNKRTKVNPIILLNFVSQWESNFPIKLALDYTFTLQKRLSTPWLHYIPLRLSYHGYQYIIRVPKANPTIFNTKLIVGELLDIPIHLFQISYENDVMEDMYTIDQ